MDYVTYGLLVLAGGLLSHLLFNRGPGPFEKTIWYGLYKGKRVVVSLDDEAFIFELINNKLRITRGTTEWTEDSNGILADNVVGSSGSESIDSAANGVSNGKAK